jgi:hypothetical protein
LQLGDGLALALERGLEEGHMLYNLPDGTLGWKLFGSP